MFKYETLNRMMTSELLFDNTKPEICKAELNRRLKSIGLTDEQIEKFVTNEQAIIDSSKSNYDDKFMAEEKFFSCFCPRNVNANKLTISELLLITEEATNEYPTAKAGEGGFKFFNVISEYARQLFAKGYNTARERLGGIGLEEDQIKKFVFAEWQIIRRVSFNDSKAVDAWGNPEKYLS